MRSLKNNRDEIDRRSFLGAAAMACSRRAGWPNRVGSGATGDGSSCNRARIDPRDP